MNVRRATRPKIGVAVAVAAVAAAATGVALASLPQQSGSTTEGNGANQWFESTAHWPPFGIQRPAYIGDINGDGIGDWAIGVPAAYNPSAVKTGAVYVVFGRPGSTGPGVDLDAAGLSGFVIYGAAANDQFGSSVAAAGDVNGDHLADLVVGAENDGSGAGAAYVIYGKASTSSIDAGSLGSDGFEISGTPTGSYLGTSVAGVGDINGDGRPDVAVGAPGEQSGDGVVYLVASPASTTNVSLTGTATFAASTPYHYAANSTFGAFVGMTGQAIGQQLAGVGDFDGDGHPDVAFSGQLSSTDSTGLVEIPSLPGTLTSAPRAGTVLVGPPGSGQAVGASIAPAGDFNGDGHPDLVVGDPTLTSGSDAAAGAVLVLYGGGPSRALESSSFDSSSNPNGFEIVGQKTDEALGTSVSAAGDMGDAISGTPIDDIVAGAQSYTDSDGNQIGEALVVFGDTDADRAASGGTLLHESDLVASAGVDGFQILGSTGDLLTGSYVGGGGDVNGDTQGDALVAVPNFEGMNDEWGISVVSGYGTPTLSYGDGISGQVGAPMSVSPSVLRYTGPVTITATSPLPPGLSLNSSTGVISGTPTQSGSSSISLTIADQAGSVSSSVNVTIAEASTTTTATTTTTAPPPPPPPSIKALSVSPRRFAVGRQHTAVQARSRTRLGTIIAATISSPATVTFAIAGAERCVKQPHGTMRTARAKRCPKPYSGRLIRATLSGRIRLAFSGRVGSHPLPVGTYRLTATARGADGRRGPSRSTTFTIAAAR